MAYFGHGVDRLEVTLCKCGVLLWSGGWLIYINGVDSLEHLGQLVLRLLDVEGILVNRKAGNGAILSVFGELFLLCLSAGFFSLRVLLNRFMYVIDDLGVVVAVWAHTYSKMRERALRGLIHRMSFAFVELAGGHAVK